MTSNVSIRFPQIIGVLTTKLPLLPSASSKLETRQAPKNKKKKKLVGKSMAKKEYEKFYANG